MSGSWSNTETNLIVLVEQTGTYSGLFGYSPAPGAGTLVLSITATSGTDPYGNVYPSGITTYDRTNDLFTNVIAGSMYWGQLVGGAVDIPDGGEIRADGSGVTTITGTNPANTAFTDSAELRLEPGEPSQHGAANLAPYAVLTDVAGSSQTDLGISGALIKATLSGGLEQWQTPAAASGWTNVSFRYRLDGQDNLVLSGEIDYAGTSTPSAGGAVVLAANLPAAYSPSVTRRIFLAHLTSTSVVKNTECIMQVSTTGAVSIQWSDAVGTAHDVDGMATGDRLYVEASVPLGNIL